MKIAVVSFSPVARDGRVLRTSHALAEFGHDVHVMGYGAEPNAGAAHFHSLGPPPTRLQHWAWVLTGYAPSIVSPRLAQSIAPLRPLHRRCRALFDTLRP